MDFVQYSELTMSIGNVDIIPNFLCLRWYASDKIKFTQGGFQNNMLNFDLLFI